MNNDLVAYYHARANEYEKIYQKPERQQDIITATEILQETFVNKNVLEIACGTGFWTERIATTALSVIATDINQAVLDVAKQKTYSNGTVTFKLENIFSPLTERKYESLFGGFIWSHIKLEELDIFIDHINKAVEPNGMVVLMDNLYVEGSSTPITETDIKGNTYQKRILEDGTNHMVLKNFPSEEFIFKLLAGKACNIKFRQLTYFWILTYNTSSE